MEAKKIKSSIAIVLGFLLIMCVTQCSPKTQIIKEDDEAVLRRRVQEYWSYKVKGQWDKVYVYESPDYQVKVALSTYASQNARSIVKWEGFNIIEVWTSGEEGNVKVNTKYRYILPQTSKAVFDRVIEEKWVKKDGEWYRLVL